MTKEEFEDLICDVAQRDAGGDPETFMDLFMPHPERLSALVSLMEGRKVSLCKVEVTVFEADPMGKRILVAACYDERKLYPFIWTREIQDFCGMFFAGYEKTFEMYLRNGGSEMTGLLS